MWISRMAILSSLMRMIKKVSMVWMYPLNQCRYPRGSPSPRSMATLHLGRRPIRAFLLRLLTLRQQRPLLSTSLKHIMSIQIGKMESHVTGTFTVILIRRTALMQYRRWTTWYQTMSCSTPIDFLTVRARKTMAMKRYGSRRLGARLSVSHFM